MTETPHQRQPPKKLFLETSAQIFRLVGSPQMQKGINALIDADPKPKLGTSACVKREFDHTYVKLFDHLDRVVAKLPDPSRSLPFDELWQEIEGLMPPPWAYPGGPKFLSWIGLSLRARLRKPEVSPAHLRTLFGGLKERLKTGFLGEIISDRSTCDAWRTRGSCPCTPEVNNNCKLKQICITSRADLLATATTLAGAKREESKWLQKNLELIYTLEGKELMSLFGKNPGHVGDLIIFAELPDSWTILSRDETFKILAEEHRPTSVQFYKVRLPRLRKKQACKVKHKSSPTVIDGSVLNYSATGARIDVDLDTAKTNDQLTITANSLGTREGKIVDKDPKPPYGVKF